MPNGSELMLYWTFLHKHWPVANVLLDMVEPLWSVVLFLKLKRRAGYST